MMNLEPWQWAMGAAAAFLIGVSKTGVPGVGILVVSLLASVFGGRPSVGIMLPMLLFGDFFAVAWYRRHALWNQLIRLLPWVVVGMAVGAAALWAAGETNGQKDIMNTVIGSLVLVMLALHLVQRWLPGRLAPHSRVGVAATGAAAGFATTVSNAAGPIMSIYMSSQKMPKEQFMGTGAWYYLIINLSKVPVFVALTAINPQKPIITLQSVEFVGMMTPVILIGVFLGKWMLPRIPQKAFDAVILALAAAAAINLLLD